MRVALATLVIGLIGTVPCPAQSRVSLGFEIGYTHADFTGADAGGTKARTGATAGAFIQFPLARWLALTVGPSLAAKGGRIPLTGASGNTVDIDLTYIDLPVLFRARIPIGRFSLLLEGGGVPGGRIGCNVDLQQAGLPTQRIACNDPAIDSIATFRSWDVAVAAGAGIGIPLAGAEIALKARFTRGLLSVEEQSAAYNQSLTLLLVVPF